MPGGRLYLTALDADLIDWLRGTGRVGGAVQTAGATPVLGESTYAAYLDAATWLTGEVPQASRGGDRTDQRSASGAEPKRSGDTQE